MYKRSQDLDNLEPIDSSNESEDITREVIAAAPAPVGGPCQYFRFRAGNQKKSRMTELREQLEEDQNNASNFGNN